MTGNIKKMTREWEELKVQRSDILTGETNRLKRRYVKL